VGAHIVHVVLQAPEAQVHPLRELHEPWLLRKTWQRGHTQGMFLGGEVTPHQLFPETQPDSPMNSLLNILNQEASLDPTNPT
jgi:hypothetical protein